MAACFINQGPSDRAHLSRYLLLLLLAALFSTVCGDTVTLRRCERPPDYRRVLDLGLDAQATSLNLISCGIKQFAFDGTILPNLKEVSQCINNLEYIDRAVFSVFNLTSLALCRNELREISVCGTPALFPHLKYLRLDYNRIISITASTFSTCVKLERLNLNYNAIEYIHSDAFKPLNDLKKLYLNKTKIVTISEKMFQLKSLDEIHLDNNLFEYPPIAFHGTAELKLLNLHNNRIAFLPAHFASELRLDYFYFYDNPWYCACLLEHLADATRRGPG